MTTNLQKGYVMTDEEISRLETIAARLYIECCRQGVDEEIKNYVYELNEIINHMKDYYAGQLYKDLDYMEILKIRFGG